MKGKSTADFLIRVVLDDAFRELALDDPQRAFEGYDLSPAQREILSSRSERLLDLLGAAAPQSQPPSDQQAATTEPPAPAAALPELPDVKLVLRLAPQVVEGPGSEAKVAYGASLLPWPLNDASGEQPDNHGQAGLSWLVQLSPMVVDAEEAGVRVAYSASIRPLMEGAEKHQPPTPPQTASKPEGTWTHDLESPAVKAAAQAVRSCDAGQRYDKLLELIEAVQVGGHRG